MSLTNTMSGIAIDRDLSVTDCHIGVPQESVLGPILFPVYISPIADLVLQYGVSLQQCLLAASSPSSFLLPLLCQYLPCSV